MRPRDGVCSLEADEVPDERVVAGVGGVPVALGEEPIEPMLGRREWGGNGHARGTETRRPDRHEERLDRLDAALEVCEPPLDEVGAWKTFELPTCVHERTVPLTSRIE